jgi:radical SAM superfamily enzyme YgiQ (UPF0313 family)
MKPAIFFADLTHTAQGISAATFPLGVSFVMSYARKELGAAFDMQLFKMPQDLEAALRERKPVVLACSNYSWNLELTLTIARLAKQRYPSLIVVLGGPNFPTEQQEQTEFLLQRPEIDFYVQLEGELAFVDLITKLHETGFNVDRFKATGERIVNTCFIRNKEIVRGPVERIKDVNSIPSPYLSGILDPFFEMPLVPMVETTRGCPFTCTFCADGLPTKSRITRYDSSRTRDEIYYIAQRLKNIDELIITDLNFAMYKEDLETARVIAEVKTKFHWPKVLSASAGKNMPHRTIEVAKVLGGTWTLGASIQSTDPEVLSAIKRDNISSQAYQELIDFGNSLKTAKTHSEIILGLPGDTKQKHFESLRFGIENRVNSIRMFQAMLLRGTEMATPATREKFGLQTKFRSIPGCVGTYDFFGETYAVSEIEEIIVGSSSLPFSDYIDCRVMNLFVETFYNNSLFEEAFGMLDGLGVSPFDCLVYLKNHTELYPQEVRDIIEEFVVQTSHDLFDSEAQAKSVILTPETVQKYIGGELGINELLVHRAMLYIKFEVTSKLLYDAIRGLLAERSLLTPAVASFMDELERFTLLRKRAALMDTTVIIEDQFTLDFQAAEQEGFKVDPNSFPRLENPVTLRFFHTTEQQTHIRNQTRVYADTPIGLGRLLQRSNLKLMYRTFEPVMMDAPATSVPATGQTVN